MFKVIVNFLDYYLLFCSDLEVVYVQPGGSGVGCSGAPLLLVTSARKCTWDGDLGVKALRWLPSPALHYLRGGQPPVV